MLNGNHSEKNSDIQDSVKLLVEASLEHSSNKDEAHEVHSDPKSPLHDQEEIKNNSDPASSILKQEENSSSSPKSSKIPNSEAQLSSSAPIFEPKQDLNSSEKTENSADLSELTKKFDQDLQISTNCSLSHDKEKDRSSVSPKLAEEFDQEAKLNSSFNGKIVENGEEFNEDQLKDGIKQDVDFLYTSQGIAKMIGCFRILLDRRLKKVKKANEMSNQEQPTKIALEIIPLFEKFSYEYLNGAVSLCYNSSRAWVRGLKFTEDLDNNMLEELRTQALVQGFYLKLVRKGYLKAVYSRL